MFTQPVRSVLEPHVFCKGKTCAHAKVHSFSPSGNAHCKSLQVMWNQVAFA